MATCPKCKSRDNLTLSDTGPTGLLSCEPCGWLILGTIEHGHLIPYNEAEPILALTGGGTHADSSAG